MLIYSLVAIYKLFFYKLLHRALNLDVFFAVT